jgi:hypothetical protein
MKNRKREFCTSGSVRDEGGNILIYSAARERGGVAGGCGGAATDDPVDRGGETPNIYEKRVAAFQRGLEEMGFVDLSRRAIGANVHRRLCERCTGVLQFRRRRYDRLNEL